MKKRLKNETRSQTKTRTQTKPAVQKMVTQFKNIAPKLDDLKNWDDSVPILSEDGMKQQFYTGMQLLTQSDKLGNFLVDTKAFSREDANKVAPVLTSGFMHFANRTGTQFASTTSALSAENAIKESKFLSEEDIKWAKKAGKAAGKLLNEQGINRRKKREIRALIRERINKILKGKK